MIVNIYGCKENHLRDLPGGFYRILEQKYQIYIICISLFPLDYVVQKGRHLCIE